MSMGLETIDPKDNSRIWNYPLHDPVYQFKPCETTDSLTRIWCSVHQEAVRTCDLRTCDTNHNAMCHKCCSDQKVLVCEDDVY